jgi:hypothetical protein
MTNGKLDETDAIADWRACAEASVRFAVEASREAAPTLREVGFAREWPETYDERHTLCELPRF